MVGNKNRLLGVLRVTCGFGRFVGRQPFGGSLLRLYDGGILFDLIEDVREELIGLFLLQLRRRIDTAVLLHRRTERGVVLLWGESFTVRVAVNPHQLTPRLFNFARLFLRAVLIFRHRRERQLWCLHRARYFADELTFADLDLGELRHQLREIGVCELRHLSRAVFRLPLRRDRERQHAAVRRLVVDDLDLHVVVADEIHHRLCLLRELTEELGLEARVLLSFVVFRVFLGGKTGEDDVLIESAEALQDDGHLVREVAPLAHRRLAAARDVPNHHVLYGGERVDDDRLVFDRFALRIHELIFFQRLQYVRHILKRIDLYELRLFIGEREQSVFDREEQRLRRGRAEYGLTHTRRAVDQHADAMVGGFVGSDLHKKKWNSWK